MDPKSHISKFNLSKIETANSIQLRLYPDYKFTGFHAIRKPSIRQNTISSRERSNNRAKKNIINLINNNFTETFSFITLTFKENISDTSISNTSFSSFIRKLKKYISKESPTDPPLKYLCTIEFQKRGAVHYHIVCNLPQNLNYSNLISLWNKSINENSAIFTKGGSLKINRFYPSEESQLIKIGYYIAKYMSKSSVNKNLCGKKTYFTSKNLKKPIRTNYTLQRNMIDISNKKEAIAILNRTLNLNTNDNVKNYYTYKDAYTQKEILFVELDKK